jgi:hypothetical protein
MRLNTGCHISESDAGCSGASISRSPQENTSARANLPSPVRPVLLLHRTTLLFKEPLINPSLRRLILFSLA